MTRRAVFVALMFAAAPSAHALTFDSVAARNRPVSKVITLLKDMNKQLQAEAEEDEEIYDKMACWCETNDKDKTKSIADAEGRIKDLTTKIEELSALSAQLGTEIKNHEKEVQKNQEALDEAIAIREKQAAAFNAEEKDLLGSISALKAALTVLGKHNGEGESFLQLPSVHTEAIAATLQRELVRHRDILRSALTPSQRRVALSFLQAPGDYFDAAPTFKQSYAPQSGEIFGILGQMKETFEANLASAQKEEEANQKAFEDLKAAKEEEIASGTEQVEKKSEQLADTDEKNAQAKTDIQDTKASLAADEEFLASLKEKCSMTDGEWEERQKTRQLEMEAVSKALAVLSGDDAHDLFGRTFNPALAQISSSAALSRRQQASLVLKAAAERFHSPKLAALSYRVRLDAFTRVKQAIDELMAQLAKDKAAEIKHKDFCVDEFNTNKLQTEKKEREKQDLVAKVEDLEGQIHSLTEAIDALKAEIAEMQVQLKRAGEDREKQNKEFQTTVTDQRATQKLLEAALTVLQDFYGDKAAQATALMQQELAGPPPPAGFEEYKKNAASGGVMSMIEQIIADAKAMAGEAIRSEEYAQKAYEDFVKETNASIETKSKDIVSKSDDKAQAEAELVEAQEAKEAALAELEHLANYKTELHQSCDFILKNFDLRQTARDEEVEALQQAKAILSGAKFEAFLQA